MPPVQARLAQIYRSDHRCPALQPCCTHTAYPHRTCSQVFRATLCRDGFHRPIVTQKTAEFEPEKFEDHYEEALVELINAKRNGKTVGQKPRPRGENVVDLMDALKKSLATEATTTKGKKPRKASAGQKEMLLPIEGKRGTEKKAAKPVRATGRKKAG